MILYSLVARVGDGALLAEATPPDVEGNFVQVTQLLLERLLCSPTPIYQENNDLEGQSNWYNPDFNWEYPSAPFPEEKLADGARKTFKYSGKNESEFDLCGISEMWGDVMDPFGNAPKKNESEVDIWFHTSRRGDLIYLCIADEISDNKNQMSFVFLEEIHTSFTTKYTPKKIEKSNAYAMDKEFSPSMLSLMHAFNSNTYSFDEFDPRFRVKKLNAQIQDLSELMGYNISILLQRGESIEALMDKSEKLENDVKVFKKKTKKLNVTVSRKSMKLSLILGGVVVGIIGILVVAYLVFSQRLS